MLLLCMIIYAQETDLPDFTPPSPEAAAMTQYGNIEIILNEEDKLVTDPKVMGTYNFGSSELAHVAKDVIPYILWGNSPDDPTTPAERFLRSEYGVHRVVEAYINSKPIGRKFRDTVTNGLWYLYDKEFIDRQPKYPRT